MGKLTAAARRKIPTKEFAGKGRSYPIEDKGHARAAIARAEEFHPSDEKTIISRARAKLRGKGRKRGGKTAWGRKPRHRADKRSRW